MKSLRKVMEGNVRACHKHLPQSYISEMDWCTLLRWMNPDERSKAAIELMHAKEITKEQAKEFAKIP